MPPLTGKRQMPSEDYSASTQNRICIKMTHSDDVNAEISNQALAVDYNSTSTANIA